MRAHLEAYGISPEFVAADNHRANGLADQVIRDFNDRMNLTCKDHWKTWHKTIKDAELSLRTNPNEDTGISPAEFLFGRPMRTIFGGLPGLVDLEEDTPRRASERLVAARLRDVNKFTDQQPSTQPHRPHAYTFQQGEQVLFKTHNDGGFEGLPARWWDRHGGRATVIEVLPHNQYLIRNAITGNEIIRSGHTLAKIPQ